ELAQQRRLRLRLDALRHRRYTKALAQLEDGAYELGVTMRLGEPVDERAVDLEHVDREPVQVRERRIARAEVVDGQSYSHGLQPSELGQVLLGVLDENALGHLQHEAVGRQFALAQRGRDVLDEVVVLELPGRDVHADRQMGLRWVAAAPEDGLAA